MQGSYKISKKIIINRSINQIKEKSSSKELVHI
jgi:hypothetical protein